MGGALRAAAVDFYHQSWRLAGLNTVLAAAALVVVYLALYVAAPLVLLAVLVGPLAAALMHCAVLLAQEDQLRFADFVLGLRLQWLRGLVLGAVAFAVVWLGVLAVRFYGSARWPLSVLVIDVMIVFWLVQLFVWPLAVFDRDRPLRAVAGAALAAFLSRPLPTIGFAVSLVLVNLVGFVAGVLPLLTLTIAYSFLAAAHYALPRSPLRDPAAG